MSTVLLRNSLMRYTVYLIVLVVFSLGCGTPGTSPNDSKMVDLASPIRMQTDTVSIRLSNYFNATVTIDSIVSDDNLQTSVIDDQLIVVSTDAKNLISNLTLYAEGLAYSIPVVQQYRDTVSLHRAVLQTAYYDKTRIQLAANGLTRVYAYWNNFRIEAQRVGDSVQVKIPPFAKYSTRSHIRVLGCTPQTVSNSVLIPLRKGKVINNTKVLNNNDWHSSIVGVEVLSPTAVTGAQTVEQLNKKLESNLYTDRGFNTLWLTTTQDQIGNFEKLADPSEIRGIVNRAHKHGLAVLLAHNFVNSDTVPEPSEIAKWLDIYDFDGLALPTAHQPIAWYLALNDAVRKIEEKKDKTTCLMGYGSEEALEKASAYLDGTIVPPVANLSLLEWSLQLHSALKTQGYYPLRGNFTLYPSTGKDKDLTQLALAAIRPGIPVVEGIPSEEGTHLLKQRANSMAMLYGTTEVLYAADDLLILRRKYFGETAMLLINKGMDDAQVEIVVDQKEKQFNLPAGYCAIRINQRGDKS